AYLTARAGRWAGKAGGLEMFQLKYRGLCWSPRLFGKLLAIAGVKATRETRTELAISLDPEALRPVAELFGLRAPALAAERLGKARRRAVVRAERQRAQRERQQVTTA